jgi:protein subunit release factor A
MAYAQTVLNTIGTKHHALAQHGAANKEKIVRKIIEIRAAEGGEDSKLFVSDLATAYSKLGMKLG